MYNIILSSIGNLTYYYVRLHLIGLLKLFLAETIIKLILLLILFSIFNLPNNCIISYYQIGYHL